MEIALAVGVKCLEDRIEGQGLLLLVGGWTGWLAAAAGNNIVTGGARQIAR